MARGTERGNLQHSYRKCFSLFVVPERASHDLISDITSGSVCCLGFVEAYQKSSSLLEVRERTTEPSHWSEWGSGGANAGGLLQKHAGSLGSAFETMQTKHSCFTALTTRSNPVII